jgi:outer membrane protein, multidrug efflux system
MDRRFARALLCVACCSNVSCAVGPDYKRPTVATPTNWRTEAATETSIANVPWWDLFKDEQLRALITVALEQNRDLKIAVERIEEARATYGIAKADLYPAVNAQVLGGGLKPSSGSLTHTPDDDNGKRSPTGYANINLGFSWELDFFGRVRRASEAQRALLLASEEGRRSVAMTLVSDVALAYIDLRGLDRRLAIAQATVKSRQENVEFARLRFEGAVTQQIDLRQAEAELHRVEAVGYNVEKLVALKEDELSFLLGRKPGDIIRNRSADSQPVPPEVPAGLPATLLEQRPDIRQAEMQLWSATARIGEAKAMLYPSITLTGSYGLASTDLTNFIDPKAQTWNIFAGLLQPIFDAGKNQARVEVRESEQRQALYTYEKTLLQALREVEDSLVTLRETGKEHEAQSARLVAEEQLGELVELRYKGGVSDYLAVLDAQRSLFNAQNDEAISAAEHSRSLVQIYKALGGGWPASQADAKSATGLPPAPAASASAH